VRTEVSNGYESHKVMRHKDSQQTRELFSARNTITYGGRAKRSNIYMILGKCLNIGSVAQRHTLYQYLLLLLLLLLFLLLLLLLLLQIWSNSLTHLFLRHVWIVVTFGFL